MKIFLFILVILFLPVTILFAHRPAGMNLKYDDEEEILDISIFHNTPNGQIHYIKKIEIYKNGAQQELLSFSKQGDLSTLEEKVSIKAESGNTFRIDAYCKNGGIIRKSLVVSK